MPYGQRENNQTLTKSNDTTKNTLKKHSLYGKTAIIGCRSVKQ